MKTTKLKRFIVAAMFPTLLIVGCSEDGDDASMTVNDFKVEVVNDTIPCQVNVITSVTSSGYNELLYLHEGARTGSLDGAQEDTTVLASMSTGTRTVIDTLELYYLKAGAYTVSLEANGQTYSDGFTLYAPEAVTYN